MRFLWHRYDGQIYCISRSYEEDWGAKPCQKPWCATNTTVGRSANEQKQLKPHWKLEKLRPLSRPSLRSLLFKIRLL